MLPRSLTRPARRDYSGPGLHHPGTAEKTGRIENGLSRVSEIYASRVKKDLMRAMRFTNGAVSFRRLVVGYVTLSVWSTIYQAQPGGMKAMKAITPSEAKRPRALRFSKSWSRPLSLPSSLRLRSRAHLADQERDAAHRIRDPRRNSADRCPVDRIERLRESEHPSVCGRSGIYGADQLVPVGDYVFTQTSAVDWFAETATMRGTTFTTAAPTPPVQPQLAKLLFNTFGRARLLIPCPLNEVGRHRFVIAH